MSQTNPSVAPITAQPLDLSAELACLKKTNREIIIAVGGTGLQTLKNIAEQLRMQGIKFGDDKHPGLETIPYAIYVDTDEGAMNGVVNAEKSAREIAEKKQTHRIVKELEGMGVLVVNIRNPHLKDDVARLGIEKQLTSPQPNIKAPDSNGCETDSRLGMLHYVTERQRLLTVVQDIARSFGGNVGKNITVTTISGLHGGMGPTSHLISADVLTELRKLFKGKGITISAEKYGMTAESADLDKQRRFEAPHQRRLAQTAVNLILWNAVDAQGGLALSPAHPFTETVYPEHSYVLGGQNEANHQVSADGGHYEPTKTIATHVALRILDGGQMDTKGGQSNNRIDRSIARPAGENQPNDPLKVFSILGASSLRTEPDEGVKRARKRAEEFVVKKGLGDPNEAVAQQAVDMLFRREDPVGGILEKAETPVLDMGSFGQAEQVVKTVRRLCQEHDDNIAKGVRPSVIQAANTWVAEAKALVQRKTDDLKENYGLKTTFFYLGRVEEVIKMIIEMGEARKQGCTQAQIDDRKQVITRKIGEIAATRIPETGFFGNLTGSKKAREDAIAELEANLQLLVQDFNAFTEMSRDKDFLKNFEKIMQKLLDDTVMPLKASVESELNKAMEEMRVLETKVTERSLRNAFDTIIPIGDKDVSVLQLATREEVQQALLEHSLPLTRAASIMSGEELFGDPQDPRKQPARVRQVSIPLKDVPGQTREEVLAKAPRPEGVTAIAVAEEGSYTLIDEIHRINILLDGEFERHSLDVLMSYPATYEDAERLKQLKGGTEGTDLLYNREGFFSYKGQSQRLLPAVYAAKANRELLEAQKEGDVRTCANEPCGLNFFVSKIDAERGDNHQCCPGCRNVRPELDAPSKAVAA